MDSKKDSLSAVAPCLLAGLGAGNVDVYKPEFEVSPENLMVHRRGSIDLWYCRRSSAC